MLSRVKFQIDQHAKVGIKKGDSIITYYVKNSTVKPKEGEIEAILNFADSLPGNSGSELKIKINQLQALMDMQATKATAPVAGVSKKEFTKRAEAAFKMCNELITDEQLKEEGPFRIAGDFARVKHALDLFNQNKMSDLGKYLKNNMNRDDRISFAKKIFIENQGKINKSGCKSLQLLINRAIEQQHHNEMTESNMRLSFPDW